MTRPPFIDAHFHLWDRDLLRYPWLDSPDNAAIAATYTIEDYRRELAGWNLVGAVHVDAGAHADDGERETAWLDRTATGNGLPSAIVARVALDDPWIDVKLEAHARYQRVRGIRHLINWHPTDAGRRAYPDDLTRSSAWRRGYAKLADHRFSFDFHGFPNQLEGLAETARAHPDVPLIINHLGLPILADGLECWRSGMRKLAAVPHASIKLSGAGFVGSPFDPADFAAIVREVIDLFGTSRVMVATNLPTDRLFASVDRILGAYEYLLDELTADERRDVWGRNANAVYRLGLSL